jgi:phage terminase large subunit-like protein
MRSRSVLGSGTLDQRRALLASLPPRLQGLFLRTWLGRGGKQQLVPDDDWPVWLILGGRGAGKTRAALRLGERPRQVVTTTPRRIALLRKLAADPSVRLTRVRTADNARNLAPGFLEQVTGLYGGTRLGRQEFDGELIEDRADALWSRGAIDAGRVAAAPPLQRIVVAVDPPASSGARAEACGIVAAGIDAAGVAYVIADATVSGLAPQGWAGRAVGLYRALAADALVAEVNQGGDMVAAVVRLVDGGVPVTPVHATRGKHARAEPVSALYAQRRVHHVGTYPELEDEMCDFGPAGLSNDRSPDRLDALVWALSYLMLRAEPRIRVV